MGQHFRLAVIFFVTFLLGAVSKGEEKDFSDILRIVTANRCLECHGPEGKSNAAKRIVLDKYTPLLKYVTKKKPDQSTLYLSVSYDEESKVMPPKRSGYPRFSDEEVEIVKKWIEDGAPEHAKGKKE